MHHSLSARMESRLLREARAAARSAVDVERTSLCIRTPQHEADHRDQLINVYISSLGAEIERVKGDSLTYCERDAVKRWANIDLSHVDDDGFHLLDTFEQPARQTEFFLQMASGVELRKWHVQLQELIDHTYCPVPLPYADFDYVVVLKDDYDDTGAWTLISYSSVVANIALIPKEIERRERISRMVIRHDLLRPLYLSLAEDDFFARGGKAGSYLYWLHMAPFVVGTDGCKGELHMSAYDAPNRRRRRRAKRQHSEEGEDDAPHAKLQRVE